jgi:hypothetical protein
MIFFGYHGLTSEMPNLDKQNVNFDRLNEPYIIKAKKFNHLKISTFSTDQTGWFSRSVRPIHANS